MYKSYGPSLCINQSVPIKEQMFHVGPQGLPGPTGADSTIAGPQGPPGASLLNLYTQ